MDLSNDNEIARDTMITLHHHRLKHISDLKVHPSLFNRRFASGCSMIHCNASCCRWGVWADVAEKENILQHSDLVLQHLEADQVRDPGRWFDAEEITDRDFPSGRAVGTSVHNEKCVFLNSAGRCVLQVAAQAAGMDKFHLKPFYCVAFPITIDNGELIVDDPSYTKRKECCSVLSEGTLDIFNVCEEELRFTLGDDGLGALKEIARVTEPQPPARRHVDELSDSSL